MARRKKNANASREDCWRHLSGLVSKNRVSIWLELGKVRITAAVSITTITGYLLHTTRLDPGLGWTILGIFLLASGASSLNHLQEYKYDSRMNRTRNRPLPSGRITEQGAIVVTLAYSIPGSVLLYFGAGMQGMLLGWLAFFWYNVVYTYLKRYTAWAVIPGSIIGSIPPLIGWVSAGGSLLDSMVIPIAAFFFIWQVPHFWLLIMKYGKEYESAGFPSLSNTMSQTQMGRMIFLWVAGTAMITVAFTLLGPMDSVISKAGLWMASAWLILAFIPILGRSLSRFKPGRYFMKINYFVLLVVVFMCLDKLLLEFLHI
jgi:protoheme IX farnesyltransferase